MGNLGCPKCDCSPVVYSVKTGGWMCKCCKHEWKESGNSISKKSTPVKKVKKPVKKIKNALSKKKRK